MPALHSSALTFNTYDYFDRVFLMRDNTYCEARSRSALRGAGSVLQAAPAHGGTPDG